MSRIIASLFGPALLAAQCWAADAGNSSSVWEVPVNLRNVYPAGNFNRNVSSTWWDTKVLDGHSPELASQMSDKLRDASFIVLDKAMYQILGIEGSNDTAPKVEFIFEFPPAPSWVSRLVHDATVYSPECNCIFFAELHPPEDGYSMKAMPWIWRTNLNSTPPTTERVYPEPQLTVANGAYYHNGSVYFTQEGNYTAPGGIVKMDPLTLKTEIVLNNFYSHRFNSPNDIVITHDGVAYFTDGYYGYDTFNDTLKPEIANGVWLWEMNTGDIRMVSGAGGGPFTNPNGVALNKEEDKLYVTNRGLDSNDPDGGRTIYEFNLHKQGLPVTGGNVFSYQESGFPDGIKVDKDGRVYASANGGVNVFDNTGRRLGIIKIADGEVSINFQWVDNWLYITGREHLYRVKLNSTNAQAYS